MLFLYQYIAKESKSFFDGEFVKECMQHIIDDMCSEKKCLFKQVSLITLRIEDFLIFSNKCKTGQNIFNSTG